MASFIRSHIINKAAWLLVASFWLAPGLLHAQAANSIEEHEQRAHEDLAQKHPELAIPEFEAVLAVDPGNLDAQANLGVLLFFQNKFAAAVPYLRAAVAQKPDLSKIQALLGLAEKALGQNAHARTDLEAAVPQLAEPAVRVQAGLALIELYAEPDGEAEQLDKSAAVVALLRQVAPADPRVLYTAYRIASDQAGEALLSLSVAAPGSPQMHQAIAHELVRARDVPGTIENLRKAAALDSTLPGVHYELAQALAESDDPKLRSEAESQYRLALVQNPRDARSLAALGDLAVARSDLPGATGLYQQALTIEPHLAEANLGLATVHVEQGDSAGAAALLEQAIAADPTNAPAHYRLSLAYRRLGRQADAERELAEYKRYKELKEKLRVIYKELRQPESEEPTPVQPSYGQPAKAPRGDHAR